ncbi:hypothetical protein [Clostridium sp.]|uniref:hypothetical protein n=1 Tax=Clostridium sp. TaxID=1506 RepID=UPI002602717C|nr:hypothetical protein [Clostridium sp.]
MGKSNTQKNIYLDEVKNVDIAMPNNEEQEIIILYIEEKMISINNLIINTQQQIQKLEEAKQALISEAVTRKIEILD